jgi:cold shock CspA family protein
MSTGTIVPDQGCGFIVRHQAHGDIFFYRSDVKFEDIRQDDEVEFEIAEDKVRYGWRAKNRLIQ